MSVTITTNPSALATNERRPGVSSDDAARSYVVNDRDDAGVIYLARELDDCTVGDGFEWDFAKHGPFRITLELGESVYARTATGSVDLDTLALGR